MYVCMYEKNKYNQWVLEIKSVLKYLWAKYYSTMVELPLKFFLTSLVIDNISFRHMKLSDKLYCKSALRPKHCNINGRSVWTAKRLLKNKPHLITFHERILVLALYIHTLTEKKIPTTWINFYLFMMKYTGNDKIAIDMQISLPTGSKIRGISTVL